jgi:hypothetical protein
LESKVTYVSQIPMVSKTIAGGYLLLAAVVEVRLHMLRNLHSFR